MTAQVIDINEARKSVDWKRRIKQGPVDFHLRVRIPGEYVERSEGKIVDWNKKNMAHEIGMFLMESGAIRFEEVPLPLDHFNDPSTVELRADIDVFVGAKTLKSIGESQGEE